MRGVNRKEGKMSLGDSSGKTLTGISAITRATEEQRN